jgi:putative ABC transport system permease protein
MNPDTSPALPRQPAGLFALRRLWRTVQLGLKSLWLHRLRSLLTVLGIVFGVCSVIAMLAIGEGASYAAQEEIKTLGSQNIILRSVKPPEQQKVTQQANQSYILQYGITYADFERIRQTIPGVELVIPGRTIREYVWNLGRRVDCDIIATIPDYLRMRNQEVATGRFFGDVDMDRKANLCVLGAELVPALFPLDDPLGRHVRVGSEYYTVIGVLEPRGVGPATGENEDPSKSTLYRMFIPLETAKARFGEIHSRFRSGSYESERVELHELTVRVQRSEEVIPVAEAIKTLMDRNHKKLDYQVVVPLELLQRAERTKRIFNIVLGSIAAISLLVGGIGIMNIMLSTVTERTREIGIRRALGARRRDITTQFLVETVILSGSGGVIGVILGLLIPFLVTWFAGMKTIITLWSPLLAFSISVLVGMVFGLYPARRAAQMDPVEALRHE